MIDLLVEHSVAEVRDRDIDRAMETLVEDCVCHCYGEPAAIEQQGGRVADRAAVRANYLANMESGMLTMEGLEVEIEHFFVSDDAIARDGRTRLRLPGAALIGASVPCPTGERPTTSSCPGRGRPSSSRSATASWPERTSTWTARPAWRSRADGSTVGARIIPSARPRRCPPSGGRGLCAPTGADRCRSRSWR